MSADTIPEVASGGTLFPDVGDIPQPAGKAFTGHWKINDWNELEAISRLIWIFKFDFATKPKILKQRLNKVSSSEAEFKVSTD